MKTIFDDVDALTREKARADAAEAELAEYRSWSPSLAEALAAANAELAIWRNEDAREAKYEAVSQRCTKAEEALAAARRECDVLRMALENLSAHLDFSEPCEAGDLGILDPSGINAAFAQALKALAAPAAAAGEEGKR